MANILHLSAKPKSTRLTPVHIEMASSVLKRAGAIGLKPKWITQHEEAIIRFQNLECDTALEEANKILTGADLNVEAMEEEEAPAAIKANMPSYVPKND